MKPSRIFLLLLLVAGCAVGGFFLSRQFLAGESRHHWLKQSDAAGRSYWTCAMHPEVHQDHPGNCPACGMKLIEKMATSANAQAGDSGVVSIDPRMVQNLGVRTARVRRGKFWQRVDATGSIVVDEHAIVVVESRTAGFIERLQVRAAGEPVAKGQLLAALYAPETLAVQEELAMARKSGDSALVDAAQARLRLLGATAARGSAVPQQTSLVSPIDGVVLELLAREGQQLTPGMPLMRLADLHRVWAEVEVPEALASRVHLGADTELRTPALPGETFAAKLDYIYPQLNSLTRSLKLRLRLDNPRLALKPGMYAEVVLFGGAREGSLLVPSEAVIRTGTRSLVILAERAGQFRPAEVMVGDEREGETEILSGLSEGETIVTSGQFLIDSEASLQGVLARMLPPRASGSQP